MHVFHFESVRPFRPLGYQGPLLQVPGVGREVRAKVALPAHVAIAAECVFGAKSNGTSTGVGGEYRREGNGQGARPPRERGADCFFL
jgi:hypothetical protein